MGEGLAVEGVEVGEGGGIRDLVAEGGVDDGAGFFLELHVAAVAGADVGAIEGGEGVREVVAGGTIVVGVEPGGAVAGLLSRSGEAVAAAVTAREPEPLLRSSAKLAREVSNSDRWSLAAQGVNVLQSVRNPDREWPALRTLACGASASSDWSYLAQRRFALFTINAIERGTRWCAGLPNNMHVWMRLTRQITAFLSELRSAGAFASVAAEQAFLVICDERINDGERDGINVLVQFAATHAGEYHSFMLTHRPGGATVRPVMVNRFEATLEASRELEQEITMRITPREDFISVLALN